MTTLALPNSFEICRDIAREHGKTYALAARILGPRQQRAVWALYAWARIVDDYVDVVEASPDERVATVTALAESLHTAIASGNLAALSDVSNHRDKLVLSAAAQTFRDFDIDAQWSRDFVESMLMDVPGTDRHIAHFHTWEQLERYMWGSAAVIGLEMMPILGTRPGVTAAQARPFAADLGRAFQLTNFLRDVAEDYRRGRIYFPLEELAAFGVTAQEVGHCVAHKSVTPRLRAALAYLVAHNRAQYRKAHPGVSLLANPGRQAISAAEILYSDILGEIEKVDYNVFATRVSVGKRRRALVALPRLACGLACRRG